MDLMNANEMIKELTHCKYCGDIYPEVYAVKGACSLQCSENLDMPLEDVMLALSHAVKYGKARIEHDTTNKLILNSNGIKWEITCSDLL